MTTEAAIKLDEAFATADRWQRQFPDGGTTTDALVTLKAEVVRLRSGWLRVIQAENRCRETGIPCDPRKCGCLLEQDELAKSGQPEPL